MELDLSFGRGRSVFLVCQYFFSPKLIFQNKNFLHVIVKMSDSAEKNTNQKISLMPNTEHRMQSGAKQKQRAVNSDHNAYHNIKKPCVTVSWWCENTQMPKVSSMPFVVAI